MKIWKATWWDAHEGQQVSWHSNKRSAAKAIRDAMKTEGGSGPMSLTLEASKDSIACAKRDVQWIQEKAGRMCEPNPGLNARDWKSMQARFADLMQLLNACQRKLPT